MGCGNGLFMQPSKYFSYLLIYKTESIVHYTNGSRDSIGEGLSIESRAPVLCLSSKDM